MKITLLTPALVAILGLALVGSTVTAQAQTSTNSAVATAPAKAKLTKYEGTLTAVNASSVTVTTTKAALTLAIAPTTEIQKDKKTATLADFAVGDKVTGSYSTDSTGALTAHSLRKKSAAAPAKTAAPATTTTPAAQ